MSADNTELWDVGGGNQDLVAVPMPPSPPPRPPGGLGDRPTTPDVRDIAVLDQEEDELEAGDESEEKKTKSKEKKGAAKERQLTPAELDMKARTDMLKHMRKIQKEYIVSGGTTGCNILVGMKLRPDSTATEILGAIADFHTPAESLRNAGAGPKDLAYLLSLWPRAIRAGPEDQKKARTPWLCLGAFTSSLVVGGFAGLMIFVTSSYSVGWEEGTCKMRDFSNNNSCTAPICQVNVLVRMPGRAQQYIKRGWEMPLKKDYITQGVALKGDPFVCCDATRTLNCCAFYNKVQFTFCDDWPHLNDPNGNPCPEGKWSCLFKLGVIDPTVGEEVTELMVYDPPDLLPFFFGIGIFSLLALIFAFGRTIRKCVRRTVNITHHAWSAYEMRKIATSDSVLVPQGDEAPAHCGEEKLKKKDMTFLPPTIKEENTEAAPKFAKKALHNTVVGARKSVFLTAEDEVPEFLQKIRELEAAKEKAQEAGKPAVSELEQPTKQEGVQDSPSQAAGPAHDDHQEFRHKERSKEALLSVDISGYANQHTTLLFTPVIEPLPPGSNRSNRSARSRGGSTARGGSAHSHGSSARRRPADPASNWAWANQDQLSAGGLQTISDSRPSSPGGASLSGHSLRVAGQASKRGQSAGSSRSGRSGDHSGGEAGSSEFYSAASHKPRHHAKGAAFAGAAVRGKLQN